MLRKRLLTFLQIALFLSLGLLLVWWMARKITPEQWVQIDNSLTNAKFWLLIPVFGVLVLSHYLRALRWKILMEPLGYHPSSFNVFNAVMVGYMANLAVPRLGEVLKCTLLARYEKVAPDKLVGTIVAERAVDVVCLLATFLITILLQADVVGSYALSLVNRIGDAGAGSFSWMRLFLLLGILAAGFLAAFWLYKRFSHMVVVQKISNVVRGVWSGLISIRYIKKKGLFILYSIGIWTMYFLGCRIGFYALQEVDHLGIKEAFSVLSFGSIGMLAPTQGGIGAYQYIVQQILMLYDISEAISFAFGWILWLAQTMVLLVGGLFSLLILPVYNRNKSLL
jgi:glycosyltransferase 2 family protein